MKRTRIIGPVVRISKNTFKDKNLKKNKSKKSLPPSDTTTHNNQFPPITLPFSYSIVNKEHKESNSNKSVSASSGSNNNNNNFLQDSVPNWGKNRTTKLYNQMAEIQKNPKSLNEWKCALCQLGPMENMMGDLYGPYYVILMNIVPPIMISKSKGSVVASNVQTKLTKSKSMLKRF